MVWTIELNLYKSIEWYGYPTGIWEWREFMPIKAELFRREYNYMKSCFTEQTEHKIVVF